MHPRLIEAAQIQIHIDEMRDREELLRMNILKLQAQADTIHQERIKLTISFKKNLED